MRRLRLVLACTLAGITADGRARGADTRAFDLDHLQIAVTSPEFLAVEGAGPSRPWAWQAGATWRFSTGSLLGDTPSGETKVLIGSRMLLNVGGGVTFSSRFGLGLDVPLLLGQSGDAAIGGAAVGDLRLVGRLNAFATGGLRGAVLLACRLPTGDSTRFLGEGAPVIEPRAVAEWSGGMVRLALNLGVRIRNERTFGDLTVGDEAFAAAALGVRPLRWLDTFGEAHIDTALSSHAFDRAVTPVELLAGAGAHTNGFSVRAAVGFGVVEGYGSPSVRVLVGVSYSPEPTPPRLRAEERRPVPPPPPPPVVAPPPPPPPIAEEVDEEEEEEEEEAEEPPPDGGSVRVNRDSVVLVDPVFFIRDSARIRSRFRPELTELARAVNARPWIQVLLIEGHADLSGPAVWNRNLSQLRAQRVVRFLIDHGVAPNRLRAVGAGAGAPWFPAPEGTDCERNRRVTFFIEREQRGTPVANVAEPPAQAQAKAPESGTR